MFDKIFESLYLKVFVNIVVSNTKTVVYIENISKQQIIDKVEKVFETVSLDKNIETFIKKYTDESPYFYISILNNSSTQGVLPTCKKEKYFYYEDVSESKIICLDKKWSIFSSKKELTQLKKEYKSIGVDFIFSPFVVLSTLFEKDIKGDVALYILLEEQKISLTIFQNSDLLYGNYLNVEDKIEDDENLLTYDVDLDEGVDLEDVDAMEHIDMFDDFADIEDLDDIDDIDEFSDVQEIDDDFSSQSEEEIDLPPEKEDTFSVDYQRFTLIQNAVNHFYNDEKYENIFIENIFIADGTGIGAGLSQYLEEEMFLNVHYRVVDIGEIVSKLAKKELK